MPVTVKIVAIALSFEKTPKTSCHYVRRWGLGSRETPQCIFRKGVAFNWTVAWDFWTMFYHESIAPRPEFHRKKYFKILPQFRGYIHKFWFTFLVPYQVPRKCSLSVHYIARKVFIFWDLVNGKWALSAYHNVESEHFPGYGTWKYV